MFGLFEVFCNLGLFWRSRESQTFPEPFLNSLLERFLNHVDFEFDTFYHLAESDSPGASKNWSSAWPRSPVALGALRSSESGGKSGESTQTWGECPNRDSWFESLKRVYQCSSCRELLERSWTRYGTLVGTLIWIRSYILLRNLDRLSTLTYIRAAARVISNGSLMATHYIYDPAGSAPAGLEGGFAKFVGK